MSREPSTHRQAIDSTIQPNQCVRAAQAAELVLEDWKKQGFADLPGAIEATPLILKDRSVFLDLVQTEFRERRTSDKNFTATDYCRRFTSLDRGLLQSIHRLIEVELYLGDNPDLLPLADDLPWPKAGDRFDSFNLMEEIGRGAVSRVFLASQPSLGDRRVVLKVTCVLSEEAAALGKLDHPNIVPVHHVGVETDSGLGWICMPFQGRRTLQDLLPELAENDESACSSGVSSARDEAPVVPDQIVIERSSEEQVIRLFSQLACGLAYTHSCGILHGDLKPSNVLLTDGDIPKLIDFNLAKGLHSDLGVIGGTLSYMAPEQLHAIVSGADRNSFSCNRATEVFSFGVMLYQLLTGRLPFRSHWDNRELKEVASEMLVAQANATPHIPGNLSRMDQGLRRIVVNCLLQKPNRRPQGFDEICRDLQQLQSAAPRIKRLVRRHPYKVAGVSFASITIAGALSLSASLLMESNTFHRAERYFKEGDYESAATLLQTFVANNPESVTAFRLLGTSELENGNAKAASDHFLQAWQASKEPIDKAMVGYSKNLAGDYKLASHYYEQCLQAQYATAAVEHNLAASLLQAISRDYDNDLSLRVGAALERAYQLAPDNETIRVSMLRHHELTASNPDRTVVNYPVSIAEPPHDNTSAEFCQRAAKFLLSKDSDEQIRRNLGLPLLKRAAGLLDSPLGFLTRSTEMQAYQSLATAEELQSQQEVRRPPRLPQFLNPMQF